MFPQYHPSNRRLNRHTNAMMQEHSELKIPTDTTSAATATSTPKAAPQTHHSGTNIKEMGQLVALGSVVTSQDTPALVASRSSSQRGIPYPLNSGKETRKLKKSDREKHKREEMNRKYDMLRNMLNLAHPKPEKYIVLTEAISLIEELKRENAELKAEKTELRLQVFRLTNCLRRVTDDMEPRSHPMETKDGRPIDRVSADLVSSLTHSTPNTPGSNVCNFPSSDEWPSFRTRQEKLQREFDLSRFHTQMQHKQRQQQLLDQVRLQQHRYFRTHPVDRPASPSAQPLGDRFDNLDSSLFLDTSSPEKLAHDESMHTLDDGMPNAHSQVADSFFDKISVDESLSAKTSDCEDFGFIPTNMSDISSTRTPFGVTLFEFDGASHDKLEFGSISSDGFAKVLGTDDMEHASIFSDLTRMN